jgi:chromosome segregation ATPase
VGYKAFYITKYFNLLIKKLINKMSNKQKLIENLREADITIAELDSKLKEEKEKNKILIIQNNKIVCENATIKQYINDYEEQIYKLNNEYEINTRNINEQISKYKIESTYNKNYIHELENEISEKNEHISKLHKDFESLDKNAKKYIDICNKLKEENKILDNELLNKKIDINKFYNDINNLENEIEKYKILYEGRNNNPNIIKMESLYEDKYVIFPTDKEHGKKYCCCNIN